MIPSLTVRQSDLSDLEASRASFPQQFKSISFAVWDVGCQDKGSLGAVVKLMPCDHEVTGSSPGTSLLQKCREKLHTKRPKWSDP